MDGNELVLAKYSLLADLARTLGHVHRLLLLEHIAQGERSVERLAELTGLSIANASQHLKLLRGIGLVQTRRDGKHILYSMGDGPVFEVMAALRNYAEHAEGARKQLIADSLNHPETLAPVSCEELLKLIEEDGVTVLDVRPGEEYELDHLPGARNIPVDELARRLDELVPGKPIVAYCRGPYCVLSCKAITLLKKKGFDARRFLGGVPEWKAAGLALA